MSGVTMRDGVVDAGGVRLATVEAGEGEPVFLLVHGLGASTEKWRDLVALLAPHGRVIAVDLPGFGRSDAPRGSYSVPWLAGGLRAFMDAAKIEWAHVVGNSLGGTVGMWLAGAAPQRVRSLTLIGAALPSVDGSRPEPRILLNLLAPCVPGLGEMLYTSFTRRKGPEALVAEGLAGNCHDPSRVSPETVKRLTAEAERRAQSPDFRRALLAAQRSMMWLLSAGRERVRRVANGLTVPTLLLWGAEDRLVRLPVAEHWVGEIPGAELIVLDEAGHNPQLEVPERVADTILAFTARSALLSEAVPRDAS